MRYPLIAALLFFSACTGEWGDWMQAEEPDEDHEFFCKFQSNCDKPKEGKESLWGGPPKDTSSIWGTMPASKRDNGVWGKPDAAKDNANVWGGGGDAAKTGSVWGPAP